MTSEKLVNGVFVLELTWLIKLRLAAAAAVGILLIGILAWPIARTSNPYAVVSLTAGNITLDGVLTLAGLAVVCGFIAYFISWPYGREIGIFAVPAGLAVWAVRTTSVANLIQANPAAGRRQAIYADLKWEPLFWLIIVLLGFAGVFIGRFILSPENDTKKTNSKKEPKINLYLRLAIAMVASVFIALICIRIFARDVSLFSRNLGLVVAQPAVGQIVFAVLISFAIAGFVVKKFLDAGYIWPIIAAGFVTLLAIHFSLGQGAMEHLVRYFPANFFSDSVLAVLPVQMVSFGVIGAIAGYWMAVRFDYWRQYEIE